MCKWQRKERTPKEMGDSCQGFERKELRISEDRDTTVGQEVGKIHERWSLYIEPEPGHGKGRGGKRRIKG